MNLSKRRLGRSISGETVTWSNSSRTMSPTARLTAEGAITTSASVKRRSSQSEESDVHEVGGLAGAAGTLL